jgi:serine protease Do
MKVVRDRKTITLNITVEELNLAAERGTTRGGPGGEPEDREPTETSLGMSIQPLRQADRQELGVPGGRGGAVITSVTRFGPAAQAGLFPGDVILSVAGQPVSSVAEVTAAFDALQSGQVTRLIVWRVDPNGRGQETLVRLRKP